MLGLAGLLSSACRAAIGAGSSVARNRRERFKIVNSCGYCIIVPSDVSDSTILLRSHTVRYLVLILLIWPRSPLRSLEISEGANIFAMGS